MSAYLHETLNSYGPPLASISYDFMILYDSIFYEFSSVPGLSYRTEFIADFGESDKRSKNKKRVM